MLLLLGVLFLIGSLYMAHHPVRELCAVRQLDFSYATPLRVKGREIRNDNKYYNAQDKAHREVGMKEYLRQRAHCRWEALHENHKYFETSWDIGWTFPSQLLPPLPVNISAQRCKTEDWIIDRIGPILTTGGYKWHRFYYDRLGVPDGTFYVSGAILMASDALGRAISFPPIHVHHAHVQESEQEIDFSIWPARIRRRHLGPGVHGDTSCMKDEGGTACYLWHLPPGHAMQVSTYATANIITNDVRPKGSPPMWHWGEVALKIQRTPPTQYVAEVIVYPPYPTYLEAYEGYASTRIPMDKESVNWYAVKLPIGGKVAYVSEHQHQLTFRRAFLFSAHPKDLGLWDPILSTKRSDVSVCISHTATEAWLSYHLDRCSIFNNCTQRVELLCESNPDWKQRVEEIDGSFYDRIALPTCREWTFSEEEYLTVVTFGGPPAPQFNTSALAMVHTIFPIMYEIDVSKLQTYPASLMLTGAHDPAMTWTDQAGGRPFFITESLWRKTIPWGKDWSTVTIE